jgi:hypothetical protein
LPVRSQAMIASFSFTTGVSSSLVLVGRVIMLVPLS